MTRDILARTSDVTTVPEDTSTGSRTAPSWRKPSPRRQKAPLGISWTPYPRTLEFGLVLSGTEAPFRGTLSLSPSPPRHIFLQPQEVSLWHFHPPPNPLWEVLHPLCHISGTHRDRPLLFGVIRIGKRKGIFWLCQNSPHPLSRKLPIPSCHISGPRRDRPLLFGFILIGRRQGTNWLWQNLEKSQHQHHQEIISNHTQERTSRVLKSSAYPVAASGKHPREIQKKAY